MILQQCQQIYYNESTKLSSTIIQSHLWSTTIDLKASSLSSEFLSVQLMLQAAHKKIPQVLSVPFQSHICNLINCNDNHHEIQMKLDKKN